MFISNGNMCDNVDSFCEVVWMVFGRFLRSPIVCNLWDVMVAVVATVGIFSSWNIARKHWIGSQILRPKKGYHFQKIFLIICHTICERRKYIKCNTNLNGFLVNRAWNLTLKPWVGHHIIYQTRSFWDTGHTLSHDNLLL